MGRGRDGLETARRRVRHAPANGVKISVRRLFRQAPLRSDPISTGTSSRPSGRPGKPRHRRPHHQLRADDQLFAFASTITMHHALGAAIAQTSIPDAVKRDVMKRGLLADSPAEADVGRGLLYTLKLRTGEDGDDWVRALWRQSVAENWGRTAEVRVVHYLPPTASTRAEIERASPDSGRGLLAHPRDTLHS